MNTVPDTQKIPKNPIQFILYVTRPHVVFAIIAFVAVTLAQVCSSFTSYVLKMLVDATLVGSDRVAQSHALMVWSSAYVGVLGIMYLMYRVSGFAGMQWITRGNATGYQELYRYLSQHSHSYFSDRFAGSLSNKVSNASDGAERMMENFIWGYYTGILSLFISLVLLLSVHRVVGGLYAVLIVVIVLINIVLVRVRRPRVVAFAASSSLFRGVGVDLLSNISAVRQYALREYELGRLHEAIEDRRVKDIRQWSLSEWSLLLNNLFIIAMLAAIVFVSVRQFTAGVVSAGDIILVITLVFQTAGTLVFIGSSMNGAVRLYGEMQEGLAEVLLPHDITDEGGNKALAVLRGEIAFNDVSFAYDTQDVFRNLDLTIAPGERVGIVGGSGAGKTTLVSLLLRQHDLQSGIISIDGQNIAQVTQDSLRRAVALVPQDPQLFHRSIKENIMYGNLEATDAQVENAARMAYAHEFIDVLPQKYDTLVGERGVKLSGGQRQRVVIARAILKNAPILVLDEATSALDSSSEVVIQKALHSLMEGKTVIAIAHRLSTLREMDRIVVLQDGKVAESGSHEELLKQKGVYATLWDHQVGGFIQE